MKRDCLEYQLIYENPFMEKNRMKEKRDWDRQKLELIYENLLLEKQNKLQMKNKCSSFI